MTDVRTCSLCMRDLRGSNNGSNKRRFAFSRSRPSAGQHCALFVNVSRTWASVVPSCPIASRRMWATRPPLCAPSEYYSR